MMRSCRLMAVLSCLPVDELNNVTHIKDLSHLLLYFSLLHLSSTLSRLLLPVLDLAFWTHSYGLTVIAVVVFGATLLANTPYDASNGSLVTTPLLPSSHQSLQHLAATR